MRAAECTAAFFVCWIAAVASPQPAHAQEPETATAESAPGDAAAPAKPEAMPEAQPEATTSLAAIGAGPAPTAGRVSLTLKEAIAQGIQRNTDVAIVSYDPAIADYDLKAAWGAFEPSFYSTFDHASRSTPSASLQTQGVLDFLVERESTGATGLRGALPLLGWQYDLGYNGRSATTTSFFQSVSPEYRANVTFNLTAPLLKGLLYGQAWIQVRLAKVGSQLARSEFQRNVMDIVEVIENAYWGLAATDQALAVAKKSLETSNALHAQTRAQFEVGVVSRVEVTEAEAGVADREFRLIEAESRYQAAQDSLVDAVFGPSLTPTSSLEVALADRADEYPRIVVDPEISVQTAMQKRPELLSARERLEQQRIRLQFARNQRLPQLDLVAGYGTHGLAGTGRAPGFCTPPPIPPATCPPPQLSPDYADTHNQFFQGDDSRDWNGGLRFSVPLSNTTGRANARATELELRKSEAALQREEQNTLLVVRDRVRVVRARLAQVDAAERRRLAAAEQQRAEQIRLEHGESTPFDVLEREEDLVEAQFQKIIAQRDYRTSVAALARAQGTILEDRDVMIENAMRPE